MACLAAGLLALGMMRAAAAPDAGVPILSAGFLSAPPDLRAALDPAQWQAAGSTDTLFSFGTERRVAEAPLLRVGFDDRCLYLAVTFPLPAGATPKADARDRDGQVWADDAVEVFIDPTGQHQTEYQFLVNPAGTQADLRD